MWLLFAWETKQITETVTPGFMAPTSTCDSGLCPLHACSVTRVSPVGSQAMSSMPLAPRLHEGPSCVSEPLVKPLSGDTIMLDLQIWAPAPGCLVPSKLGPHRGPFLHRVHLQFMWAKLFLVLPSPFHQVPFLDKGTRPGEGRGLDRSMSINKYISWRCCSESTATIRN